MRVRSFGDRALLLECGGTAEVRAAYAEALRRREAGELTCTDIVPAARTLLLDGLDDPASVSLDGWPTAPPDDEPGDLVELPVSYDGPDLESVAEHCGLEVEEVVRRHREAEYVVAFCGFAPGFAYLTGLPERARGAATPGAAVEGAGGLGRAGGHVHRASTRGPRPAAGS